MTDLEAIRARRSRRAYSGPMDRDQLHALRAIIPGLKLDSGLHIQLVEDGAAAFSGITHSYGMFSGVRGLITLAYRQDDFAAREAAGYNGERLVLEATKLGLGTCWVGGTFNREKLAPGLPGGQLPLAVITVGPVKEKPGFVERVVRRATHGKGAGPELYTADETPPDWFLAGVQAAGLAPSAMNKKPVRFAWAGGVATATVSMAPGVHFPLVDLGIAKLHFEIGAGGKFAPGNGGAFTKE